jgi:hypothetical protein
VSLHAGLQSLSEGKGSRLDFLQHAIHTSEVLANQAVLAHIAHVLANAALVLADVALIFANVALVLADVALVVVRLGHRRRPAQGEHRTAGPICS